MNKERTRSVDLTWTIYYEGSDRDALAKLTEVDELKTLIMQLSGKRAKAIVNGNQKAVTQLSSEIGVLHGKWLKATVATQKIVEGLHKCGDPTMDIN